MFFREPAEHNRLTMFSFVQFWMDIFSLFFFGKENPYAIDDMFPRGWFTACCLHGKLSHQKPQLWVIWSLWFGCFSRIEGWNPDIKPECQLNSIDDDLSQKFIDLNLEHTLFCAVLGDVRKEGGNSKCTTRCTYQDFVGMSISPVKSEIETPINRGVDKCMYIYTRIMPYNQTM